MEDTKKIILEKAKNIIDKQKSCDAILFDALDVLEDVAKKFDNKILNKRFKTIFENTIQQKHKNIYINWNYGHIDIDNYQHKYSNDRECWSSMRVRDVFDYDAPYTELKGKALTDDKRIIASELIQAIQLERERRQQYMQDKEKEYKELVNNIDELIATANRMQEIKVKIGITFTRVARENDYKIRYNLGEV